jgi:outer membrane protein assembly factor BamD (BamD/ComL family)
MRQAIRIAALSLALLAGAVQAQDTVRPEVGTPLQAAQGLIKAQKYKEALVKVRDAEGVPNKTAHEAYLVERMRIAAASGAGDMAAAAKAYEALSASGKVSAADKLRMVESIAGGYYRAKEYPKAVEWAQRYVRDGGNSAQMQTLLIQAQYLSGDTAGVTKELMAEVQADEKAGKTPSEDRLKLLMNATARQPEGSAYVFALERLVTYYPKKEYWAELIAGVQRKPGFSDRFSLDIYRLMLATGGMRTANDYMEMAQLALQAGFAAEGKAAIEKGFATGVLGTGAEADRQKRLRDLAVRKAEEARAEAPAREADALAAKDGTALVSVGFNQALSGQAAKGVALIDKGLAKGGLKRPEDGKLRLGQAMVLAGDPKAAGTLRTVTGGDGTADLARMWAILAKRKGQQG